jgi:hypothetical protein
VRDRLLAAAARLDSAAGPPLLDPLTRLDTAAARRLTRLRGTLDLVVQLLTVVLSGVLAACLRQLHRLALETVLPPSARPSTVPPPRHAAVRRVLGAREVAVACLAVFAVAVVGAAVVAPAPPSRTAPAAAVERAVTAAAEVRDDTVDVVPARPEARAVPPEQAPAGALPVFVPPAPPSPSPAPPPPPPATRWLPTGTGMWLHDWVRTEGGSAQAVVDRSLASGLTHLYVQTGSTKKGWIGEEVLSQLLPATAGTGLKVVAWDFPKLIDPEADALRMAAAATWERPGVPRVAAVAPDVETAAEGTQLSPDAVTRYYATLRAALPPEVAVLATVPWPSEKRTGFYPYAQTAAFSDAFVPMAYWYNRPPAVVTETSMLWLAQFGLPVMPVGQGYDGRIDAPYLPEDPDPAGSVQAFVDAARTHGAASISLWSWQTTGGPQWDVLARASAGPWTPAPAPLVPAAPPPPPAPPFAPAPAPAAPPAAAPAG